MLFCWIRSHQDFGRNVNVMRPSVYFLVCSSVRALLFVCLPSVLQPLGWEPLDFPRGQREASDPHRHGSVHFPHRGPGRGRADDERAADHAVGIARPRYASDALRWTRVAGFRGRSGCCCINAGQSDLAYVGREYGATGFAKHGSELPRVAFRGLTMSRARLWGGQQRSSQLTGFPLLSY